MAISTFSDAGVEAWVLAAFLRRSVPLRSVGVSVSFYVTGIALLLLVISNCSILNPGPRNVSVLYGNVQGLISPGHLGLPDPPLSMTKIYEIQDYIIIILLYHKNIDIVILNETWLKSKIESKLIFPRNYKVFRLDRTGYTHPRDPCNPTKFREHGGGVLIAHREDISVCSSKFSIFKARAELLTISLSLSSGKKLLLSTFYRVGTLGNDNFDQFKEHFDTIFSRRNAVKHVLVGDFNFSGVKWPCSFPRNGVDDNFLSYLLDDTGHTQIIDSPTHISGRTLDLCFTNDPGCVSNVSVLDRDVFCSSDHFAISFNINLSVKDVREDRRAVRLFDKGVCVCYGPPVLPPTMLTWRAAISYLSRKSPSRPTRKHCWRRVPAPAHPPGVDR